MVDCPAFAAPTIESVRSLSLCYRRGRDHAIVSVSDLRFAPARAEVVEPSVKYLRSQGFEVTTVVDSAKLVVGLCCIERDGITARRIERVLASRAER